MNPPEETAMTEAGRRRLRTAVTAGIGLALIGAIWSFVSIANAPADLISQQAPAPAVSLSATELDTAAVFRPFDTSIPVVAYHDISDTGTIDSITPEQFAAQMSMLDRAGFVTVTLEQVRAWVSGRLTDLPGNPILLTFDGGDLSTWVNADPVLAQHGYTGVVFVATSQLQDQIGSTYLNIDTLKKMIATHRWEVGGNTHLGDQLVPTDTGAVPWLTNRLTIGGHTETTDEWAQRIRSDLATNRQQLRSLLGTDAYAMSYPTPLNNPGEGDPELVAALPAIIGEQFDLGFRTGENPTSVGDSSVVTDLQRIRGFGTNADPIPFLGAIDESLPRSPAGAVTPTAWVVGGQGDCHSGNDTLVISDEGYTSCRLQTATADQWSDVRTSAVISGISPDARASIRIRDNGSTRLEVTLTETQVSVEQITGDVGRVLASTPIDLAATNGATPVLIEVRGTLLVVTLDGAAPLRVNVDPSAQTGAVSFAATTNGAGVITFTTLNIITFDRPDAVGQ
jgi:peptidoglycan/xylan/chitin deacetylase (PgdA/CDA1 family)